MSKSAGNYIKIDENPIVMFNEIMRIKDDMIGNYFELLTDVPKKEIEENIEAIKLQQKHPRDVKLELAKQIVAIYHNQAVAEAAKEEFISVKQKGNLPAQIPEVEVIQNPINIIDLIIATGVVASKSAARRLVEQNGVKINGQIKNNISETIKIGKEQIMQIGKDKYFKVIKSN